MTNDGASGATSAKQQKLKWKVDTDQSVIVQNFTRRGWARTEADDWNVYWANVMTVRAIFHPDSGFRPADAQLINHFPNHYELTRKDLMVKNIKRYLREGVARPDARAARRLRARHVRSRRRAGSRGLARARAGSRASLASPSLSVPLFLSLCAARACSATCCPRTTRSSSRSSAAPERDVDHEARQLRRRAAASSSSTSSRRSSAGATRAGRRCRSRRRT